MYINTATHQIFSEYDIRAAFQDTSFPTPFQPPEGYAELTPAEQPTYDPVTHFLREGAPAVDADGRWTRTWEVIARDQSDVDRSIAEARREKNAEINSKRLEANRSSFEHQGKLFACDELSRSDIDGVTSFVSLSGSLPPGWPGAWKAIDNSFHPIASVDDWKAFVASMVAAGNANFAKAQALKAQLSAAVTYDEIKAIKW